MAIVLVMRRRRAGQERTVRFIGRAAAASLVMFAAGLQDGQAAPCGGDFAGFVATFQREAIAKGVSQRTASAAFVNVTPDPQVLALDRRQGHFKRSFEEFGLPRIQQRIGKARGLMQQHAALLSRIEQQFGVPGAVVIAIWGLETDFGVNQGKQSAIRSLATLAHDCRRTERFQNELTDALRIIDRGDYTPEQLKGAWAGEIGQTQFLPSSFVRFAVDFDGNGRRDLIRSVPDVLASTANYLRGYGWQRGQGFAEGTRNYEVLKEWNKSPVYQKTISVFAQRLMGE
jgi:lytic murein transglycosylase